ncbi:uncharacterized protein PITG_10860 [Phytophthora infestans T30-4]|uniref:Uncharacterized protein n=1 Tax=Phytophthora infestans (strain T30-4) TaxID=403677 RepID=D0NH92_PHYIT|nr:uncharacterized protein PITG_10860 [Phytophthora infestans T30-4]EEY58731.1 conserved hypothetical protein [Phytophthora infestans T30-4]|eukprot:XP_002901675.1 conserved hypothetical protein [Phytophthora infestans T30-4]
MSSLLDVAKAMNAEAASNSATLSLVDVARAGNDANSSVKPKTLVDVAKQETQPKQTLQQLAQEMDGQDQFKIREALESTAKEVKTERQDLRSQVLKQTTLNLQQEEQQAAKVLQEKVGDADKSDDPPPRTTPSESKESKEFMRAVYRADKHHVRDMLNDEAVDANTADQHGWSGLHWAASQNHSDILNLLLQNGAEVNATDQINGWTALHVAIVRESISCVGILLSSGADPRIRDNYGDTVVECLQAASRKNKLKMLQLIQEARGNNQ